MKDTKSDSSGSEEEEDFFKKKYVFLWFKQNSLGDAIPDSRSLFEQTW